MPYKLEVRTTISPTPFFFRRIHFLAASLRALGGALGDYEIVVSVGGGRFENYYQTQPWSKHHPLVWRFVRPDDYARLGYRATNRDRAAHVGRADFVMMVDADVIFLRDFSELLLQLGAVPAIAGVMAHASPFRNHPPVRPVFAEMLGSDFSEASYWRILSQHFGAGELCLDQEYSGWGHMTTEHEHQFAPHYFNGGMVVGPRALMDEMCALYADAEDAVDEVMDTYFRPQLARTLACAKARLNCRALPVRYNFPNDPTFERAYPGEIPEVSVLHYLRKDVVHRDEAFVDRDAVDLLVARRDLTGVNEALRRRVSELRDIVFAEEGLA